MERTSVTIHCPCRTLTDCPILLRQGGERVLLFDLNPNLRVSSVADEHGSSLPFFQPRDPHNSCMEHGKYVAVVLPEAAVPGQSRALNFTYATPQHRQGAYYVRSRYDWYPGLRNRFAVRADFVMTFHSPAKMDFVATGEQVSEKQEGDRLVSTWKAPMPLSAAGFGYGTFQRTDESVGATKPADPGVQCRHLPAQCERRQRSNGGGGRQLAPAIREIFWPIPVLGGDAR
jgi:hypothetical protein